MASKRRLVLEAIKAAWATAGGPQYFVKRGVIDWTAHQFIDYPRAVSIQVDESSLPQPWPERLRRPFEDMDVSLEIAWRIPQGEGAEIDDWSTEEVIGDLRDVLLELERATAPNGDPLAQLFVTETRLTEFSDTTYAIQGLIVPFTLRY